MGQLTFFINILIERLLKFVVQILLFVLFGFRYFIIVGLYYTPKIFHLLTLFYIVLSHCRNQIIRISFKKLRYLQLKDKKTFGDQY